MSHPILRGKCVEKHFGVSKDGEELTYDSYQSSYETRYADLLLFYRATNESYKAVSSFSEYVKFCIAWEEMQKLFGISQGRS